ncbi:MAG: sensor histidine kinase, partial [Flavobacteriales bacterium]|nr:sensor histidine kinase [Flavobacteriales bacterium]
MSARSASIVTRITVVFTVFVVLGTLAAGLLVYRGVQDELINAARNDLRRTLDQGRTRLDGFAGTLADDIGFLSANDAMADLLAAQDSTDTLAIDAALDRVSLLLESFIRSREQYAQVRLIAAEGSGMELVRFDRTNTGVRRVDSADLQPKGARDYYLATMALGAGERYFSAIDLNKEQGRIEVPHRPTLRAAAPLFTPSGERAGIVIINADLRPLFRELEGFARGYQRLVLADAQGQVLLHPDTSRMFRHEVGGRFTLDEVTENAGEVFITEQTDWGARWLSGPHVLQVDVSRNALLAGLRRQRDLSLATTAGIALLFVLLSLLYARSIGRALDRLTARVERYAAGEGNAELPVDRRDEIGRLSRSLARMQERIDARVRDLETARADAEASDRARREMLANMSHEVRTPLNAILGMSADLDTTSLSEADQQKLGIVQRSAERLRGLVDDLLLHARIGEGRLRVEPAAVDVRTLIMDIAQAHLPVARAKGVALLTRLDDLPPTCLIDPLRLHQIVDNLVGNAVKFTPRGNVDIIASANEEELVVSVKDSGPGISKEDAVRIFQRFERA